ncbi:hypothetical protein TVAG_178100 [Trichomonas vaginalis G3]|uniref:Bacterial surface antigen (D15) domain-containing protein n=1 Tax=Trichomonas vaginalis (strain ATCC PRA-98 / G3) TaxID=412133 RepID=A2DIG2_TRIV3|nr:sorting and assembly machinery component 50-like protein family [Trichomonas vaginalis G3]EAY19766.1 hypothetical protein TVAG_178100 [Trichomonas vaginalis G3]KAI5523937.1 sorting and assembly machinery component 50-like protein family [Trichomonas vaginalis G3]|eukprot:XP_001580752.1 hypothetical protein [Trichomonas vaginalis G3]
MSSAPEWFPTGSLQEAIDEVKKLTVDDEFKEAAMKSIAEKVLQLGSIKSATIDAKTGEYNVVARDGLMKTYVGGDIGTEKAVRASTGWANFFKRGETISLTGKYTVGGNPSVNVAFTLPDFKSVDFSKNTPFRTYSYAFNIEKNDDGYKSIQSAGFEFNLGGGKDVFSKSISLSAIRQAIDSDVPFPLKYEPNPYFKFQIGAGMPSFLPMQRNQIHAGLICDTKLAVTPFVKATGFNKINLPFGISITANMGLISSLRKRPGAKLSLENMTPVPYPEKFLLGGLPTIYGVDAAKFGYKYGGFPIGSNVYASLTLDESVLIFPEQSLNGHIFLSGSIAKNFSSYFPQSCDPSWTSLAVAGVGLTFIQGQVKVEANLQKPIFQSGAKLNVLTYQLGITPA